MFFAMVLLFVALAKGSPLCLCRSGGKAFWSFLVSPSAPGLSWTLLGSPELSCALLGFKKRAKESQILVVSFDFGI